MTRLLEIIRARGLRQVDVVRLTGALPITISRLVKGQRRLSEKWIRILAAALDVPEQCLFEPVGAPIPRRKSRVQDPQAARMAAIRRAWWPNPAVAAQALGVTLEKLEAQEAGSEPIDQQYLLTLMKGTNCPPGWITNGDISGLDPRALIQIALDSPELVPSVSEGLAAHREAPDDESRKSRKASGA